MAIFNFEEKDIYYEVHGTGSPLVILNGIMMSTASWTQFVEPLSKHHTLILLDMLDQGRSAKLKEDYTQEVQVRAVAALLDKLSLGRYCVMGVSYGGEVAIQLALARPELIDRLMLFNTTACTGPWLGDIGDAWNKAATDPEAYYLTAIPVIYSPEFYSERKEWFAQRRELLKTVFADQSFIGSMVRLTNSSKNYDVLDRLHEIAVPTLVVSAEEDYLTPLGEQKKIVAGIKNSVHCIVPRCGHASMYEQPIVFTSLILGFSALSKFEYEI